MDYWILAGQLFSLTQSLNQIWLIQNLIWEAKDKNCLNGEVHDYSQANHFFLPDMIPKIAPRINGRDFLKKYF